MYFERIQEQDLALQRGDLLVCEGGRHRLNGYTGRSVAPKPASESPPRTAHLGSYRCWTCFLSVLDVSSLEILGPLWRVEQQDNSSESLATEQRENACILQAVDEKIRAEEVRRPVLGDTSASCCTNL
jgi:hypothetical protein